jgi:hypothetical protein
MLSDFGRGRRSQDRYNAAEMISLIPSRNCGATGIAVDFVQVPAARHFQVALSPASLRLGSIHEETRSNFPGNHALSLKS